MRREIPLPLAIGIIVVVLAIVAFIFWRALFKPREAELKPEEMPPAMKELLTPSPSP
jgi:flagellar biosynthesis/type III secretory pathway M-ring protein FliF/YscJ